MELSGICVDCDKAKKVFVTSSNIFQVFHAVTFVLPPITYPVSNPVKLCKIGRDLLAIW